MNTFGHIFRLTSFGESHGAAMGGVIDGVPANVPVDADALQQFVNRRHPEPHTGGTARREYDVVEVLSGIYEGRTLGTPIGFIVRNHDVRSGDYDHLRDAYRPSHADYTYQMKYGIRDHRGGGRASARETVTRMVAGALATQMLQHLGVHVQAFVECVGKAGCRLNPEELDIPGNAESSHFNPTQAGAKAIRQEIAKAQKLGDTLGGTILCVARGVPAGWGEPVAAKLHADLGAAMLSINAVKAFEIGQGHQFSSLYGSEVQDLMKPDANGRICFAANHSGGVQGGISNGNDICFRLVVKPVPTLMRETPVVNSSGEAVAITPQGRHDVTAVVRAVPIVEAMTAMVLLDHYLMSKTNHL
ncbi:MAG: chorismate synthase [Muribaculaceae bacterium]|nr:chorismate synthase [Muribaculaceae bacterium]